MNLKKIGLKRLFAALVILPALGLGGCAGLTKPTPTAPIKEPSFKEFQATQPGSAERKQLKAGFAQKTKDAMEYKHMLYTGGKKVCHDSGVCIKWDPISLTASVSYAESSGAMGMEVLPITTFPTTPEGVPIVTKGALLAAAPHKQAWGLEVLDFFKSVTTGAVYGSLAAEISKCKGSECGGGGTVLINEILAYAKSDSKSNAGAGCGSGGCSADD